MEKVLNVGLVGYGFAGRAFHAPVITSVPGLKLAKVVERRSNASQERYPWVEIVRDTASLYADESIDLVVVATPSTNHYEVAKEALLANKHVVIEKPFTTTTEEADALIKLANERGRVLSVYHNRRWDGDFMTIQGILRQNLLGKVVEFEAHWDRFNPIASLHGWRETNELGSGVVYDLCVHFIDQACCFFGLPRTITAYIGVQREGGVADDYFDVTLGYEGMKAILKSSKIVREIGPRYRIHGTKGSFVKYGLDPQEDALKAGLTPSSHNWGVESREHWGTLNTQVEGLHFVGEVETLPGNYAKFYQNIYDAIAHEKELVVKPQEARNAIRIIELVKESSALKRTLEFS